MKENKNRLFELSTLEDYSDESLLNELRRVAKELKGKRLSKSSFIELSKVHPSTLEKRFGSWRKSLDLAGISEDITPKVNIITKEILIDCLQSHAAEFPGTSISLNEIAQKLGVQGASISGRFGKWQDLLREVGLLPVAHGRRYTDEECYENIIALWTHYGRQPNFAELNKHPSKVGSKAYISRWGGWRPALSAFINHVNQDAIHNTTTLALTPSISSELVSDKSTPENTPRSIGLALRYKVLSRDKFRCVICGRSPAKDANIELHVDHIYPWSRGGKNTEENLRTLCFDCNLGKGSKIETTP